MNISVYPRIVQFLGLGFLHNYMSQSLDDKERNEADIDAMLESGPTDERLRELMEEVEDES